MRTELHVASTKGVQHATKRGFSATPDATPKEAKSLKALSGAVLQRNSPVQQPCNKGSNGMQLRPVSGGHFVASASELESLLPVVAAEYGCPPEEVTLMRETALADLESALTSFRLLVGLPLNHDSPDDRVQCKDCLNRLSGGVCRAAAEGRMPQTANNYRPVPEVLRNCENYASYVP